MGRIGNDRAWAARRRDELVVEKLPARQIVGGKVRGLYGLGAGCRFQRRSDANQARTESLGEGINLQDAAKCMSRHKRPSRLLRSPAMIVAVTITATSPDRKNAQQHRLSRDEATTTTAR